MDCFFILFTKFLCFLYISQFCLFLHLLYLLNDILSIFQLYHDKNRLMFNDMMIMMMMTRSALYYTNMLSWIFYSASSLKQQTWIDIFFIAPSPFFMYMNSMGGVMVSVLTSGALDRGFEPWSGQTKDYKM
jgi:hypothetical protein